MSVAELKNIMWKWKVDILAEITDFNDRDQMAFAAFLKQSLSFWMDQSFQTGSMKFSGNVLLLLNFTMTHLYQSEELDKSVPSYFWLLAAQVFDLAETVWFTFR